MSETKPSMDVNAPLCKPETADIIILLGPEKRQIRANGQIMASHSSVFKTFYESGPRCGPKIMNLSSVNTDTMHTILRWLFRNELIFPENYLECKQASQVLDVLKIAKRFQIVSLAEEYRKVIREKLKSFDSVTARRDEVFHVIQILHMVYKCGGSIPKEELACLTKNEDEEYRKMVGSVLRHFCSRLAYPNAKFLLDFALSQLVWQGQSD